MFCTILDCSTKNEIYVVFLSVYAIIKCKNLYLYGEVPEKRGI